MAREETLRSKLEADHALCHAKGIELYFRGKSKLFKSLGKAVGKCYLSF